MDEKKTIDRQVIILYRELLQSRAKEYQTGSDLLAAKIKKSENADSQKIAEWKYIAEGYKLALQDLQSFVLGR